jgi:hypothetical protein
MGEHADPGGGDDAGDGSGTRQRHEKEVIEGGKRELQPRQRHDIERGHLDCSSLPAPAKSTAAVRSAVTATRCDGPKKARQSAVSAASFTTSTTAISLARNGRGPLLRARNMSICLAALDACCLDADQPPVGESIGRVGPPRPGRLRGGQSDINALSGRRHEPARVSFAQIPDRTGITPRTLVVASRSAASSAQRESGRG